MSTALHAKQCDGAYCLNISAVSAAPHRSMCYRPGQLTHGLPVSTTVNSLDSYAVNHPGFSLVVYHNSWAFYYGGWG